MSHSLQKNCSPWIQILGSVALLVLCFIVNRIMNTHGARNIADIVELAILLLIGIGIFLFFKGISMLMLQRKKQESLPPSTEPIKVWDHNELFTFLQSNPRPTMIVLNIASSTPIVVRRDLEFIDPKWMENRYGYVTDKILYYIDEQKYTDFEDFKKAFVQIHPNHEIKIVSATTYGGKKLDIE